MEQINNPSLKDDARKRMANDYAERKIKNNLEPIIKYKDIGDIKADIDVLLKSYNKYPVVNNEEKEKFYGRSDDDER